MDNSAEPGMDDRLVFLFWGRRNSASWALLGLLGEDKAGWERGILVVYRVCRAVNRRADPGTFTAVRGEYGVG